MSAASLAMVMWRLFLLLLRWRVTKLRSGAFLDNLRVRLKWWKKPDEADIVGAGWTKVTAARGDNEEAETAATGTETARRHMWPTEWPTELKRLDGGRSRCGWTRGGSGQDRGHDGDDLARLRMEQLTKL
ncbi:hypothetical protein F5148DRAFT_1151162 [Russula earlei]|uniref:Uncharacterized protein n=1 Tax=Russula earlei TaxID=71964 RepID=A0ACC0U1A2_9AGAM|nr:hypothetical protein F5148DRAFT_1151162 [Russula earlei]